MSRINYELLYSKDDKEFEIILDITEEVEKTGKENLLSILLSYLEPSIKLHHNGCYILQKQSQGKFCKWLYEIIITNDGLNIEINKLRDTFGREITKKRNNNWVKFYEKNVLKKNTKNYEKGATWIKHSYDEYLKGHSDVLPAICSNCGGPAIVMEDIYGAYLTPRCPWCGSKMNNSDATPEDIGML